MTPTALNRRALDCTPLDIPLPQRLVTITPIGNSYSKIDRPIWPIYGPGVGYLLNAGLCARVGEANREWLYHAKSMSYLSETRKIL